MTKAKDKLSGPVGSLLHLKVWDDERAHEELWRGNASYRKLRAGSAQMPPLDEDGGAPSPPMRFYGV